jgi:hypothetical protein
VTLGELTTWTVLRDWDPRRLADLASWRQRVVLFPFDEDLALGRKIADARRRRGLSQPELARMIDRSVAWVSQVEREVRLAAGGAEVS